jgi:hypothetical protein
MTEIKVVLVAIKDEVIPFICVKPLGNDKKYPHDRTNRLITQAGFDLKNNGAIICYPVTLGNIEARYDLFEWSDSTISKAHYLIRGNWENISGIKDDSGEMTFKEVNDLEMEVKYFQVMDDGTRMPCMAIQFHQKETIEMFGLESIKPATLVLFMEIQVGSIGLTYWPILPRTRALAHRHIETFWDKLETETVIDIEYILGESNNIKTWQG